MNTFEFEKLKDYLNDTDYSVEDTWKECLRMMDEGVYISSRCRRLLFGLIPFFLFFFILFFYFILYYIIF